MRGGWVGSDVWDKVPNKYVFVYTFPNDNLPISFKIPIYWLSIIFWIISPTPTFTSVIFGGIKSRH